MRVTDRLRPFLLPPIALLFTWGVVELLGIARFVDRLTAKWNLLGYEPVFLVALTGLAMLYLRFNGAPGSWARDSIAGCLAGLIAGLLGVVASAWLQFGAQGLTRGLEVGGLSYVLVLGGVTIFPLCSWLFGALVLGFAGLLDRHILRRPAQVARGAEGRD